ncbi:MAG TPA: chromate transporter [Parvibaculum sp.]|jgi:chromate transport protein ChrA
MDEERLPILTIILVLLSLVSIGGGPKLMAPFAHELVHLRHWMTGKELAGLYGLTRAVPGPGGLILLAGAVGGKVAGWMGIVVAPLALILPSSCLCFVATSLWQAQPRAQWKALMMRTVAPVSVGQGVAGGIAILQITHGGTPGLVMAGAAFAARLAGLPALAVLAAGGILFWLYSI